MSNQLSREKVWYDMLMFQLSSYFAIRKAPLTITAWEQSLKGSDKVLAEFDKRFPTWQDERDEVKKEKPKVGVVGDIDSTLQHYYITFRKDEFILMLGKESEEWIKVKAGDVKVGFICKGPEEDAPFRIVKIMDLGESLLVTFNVVNAETV